MTADGEPVLHHLGVSAFATHAVVDRRSVVPVDNDVPPVVASLLGCAVLTGGGAVLNAGRPRPGRRSRWSAWAGSAWRRMLTALAHDDVRVIAVDQLPEKLDRARDWVPTRPYAPEQVGDRRRRW